MLNFKKMVLGFLFSLMVLPAHATIVNVRAEGVLYEYFDPDGRLPFAEPSENALFVIEMNYDSNAMGNIVEQGFNSTIGIYDAILSFSFSIDGRPVNIEPLSTTQVFILDNVQNVNGMFFDGWMAFLNQSDFIESTQSTIQQSLGFGFTRREENSSIAIVQSTDLIEPFMSEGWTDSTIYYQITENSIDPSGQFNSEVHASAVAEITYLKVSQVPLPGAMVFFASGVLGLLVFRQNSGSKKHAELNY